LNNQIISHEAMISSSILSASNANRYWYYMVRTKHLLYSIPTDTLFCTSFSMFMTLKSGKYIFTDSHTCHNDLKQLEKSFESYDLP
jgi:hypothetical protein